MKEKFGSAKPEWWRDYFDKKYVSTYLDSFSLIATEKQVEFLIKFLKLKKTHKILDLACGSGRHSIALAKLGFNVTAFDFSKYLLDLAQKDAKRERAKLRFFHGDMRRLKFRSRFDVIISMYTSFGYFSNIQDDADAVKGVGRSLKPRGIFLIDLNNASRVIYSFLEKNSKDVKTGRFTGTETKKLSNGLAVKLQHEFDLLKMQWTIARFWKRGGRNFHSAAEIHVYSLSELKILLESRGLFVEKEWGNYDGSSLQVDSKRMIVLARKRRT